MTLSSLDERTRDQVWAAWTAVETALAPVPARDYAALRDPALRVHIERLSTDAGRVLFETEDGWLTGYDDSVASRLAAEGLGILDENDRAVFALVLINTICLHRSQKGVSRQAGWDAPGVSSEELLRYRPQYRSVMRASLRRLEAASIIARISLDHSFSAAATAAGLIKPGEIFDAYANDRNFLFAAFLFEDVGVTAFKGAAQFISNKTYLDAAAGLLATEAYYAGIVRATLFSEGLADDSVFDVVHKISAVRNAVSGPADDDQDLGTKGEANLVPTDEYGPAFGRSAAEILNIVYLDPQAGSSGGFYPDGLNGDIVHGIGPTAS